MKFGVFADLHIDLMHDCEQRLQDFLHACDAENVDFIIQLGDFCNPIRPEERITKSVHLSKDLALSLEKAPKVDKEKILSMYRNYPKKSYHVLGNHDTDQCSKQAALQLFGAEKSYYSFDCGGWHFITLDCDYYEENGKFYDYDHGNYYDKHEYEPCLPPQELEWLKEDLEKTEFPVMIFSHQSLNQEIYGITNYREFRDIVHCTGDKVKLCINSHNHINNMVFQEGVYYFNLNSISNQWLGDRFLTERYGKEIDGEYPFLCKVAPYRDALFAIIEAEPSFIDIRGKESSFVGKSPYELKYPFHLTMCEITPRIGSYYIELAPKSAYERVI